MKIAAITFEPCIQRQQDADWKFARAAIPETRGWTIRTTSDSGVTGLGYGHALAAVTGHPAGVGAALELLKPRLIGRDTADLAGLVAELDATVVYNPSAKAGLEMALYDLIARSLGTSVGTLVGGRHRTTIPCSRLIPLKSPDEMAAKCVALVGEGYRTLKLKLSGDPALDRDRIAASRRAVGPGVKLTLDPNQSYSAKGFLKAWAGFEAHDIALVEQPVPANDLAGLALVTRELPVAVEADEAATSLAEVTRIANERIADVINLKIAKLGGVQATLASIAVCEANGIGCRFGASFGPSLLQAFSAHLVARIAQLEHACELAEHMHLLDDPFSAYPVVGGEVTVPTAAGTGVEYVGRC